MLPLPYVVHRPGPTLDTLGTVGDTPVIRVDGVNHLEASGELRLTTVSEQGGPGNEVRAARVLEGWLRSDSVVLPRDEARAAANPDDVSEALRRQMESSQENASAAALAELGYEVPMVLTVAEVMDISAAGGLLLPGDVIAGISRGASSLPIFDFRELTDFLAATPAGTPVTLAVQRDGEDLDVTFPTVARPEGDDRPGSLLAVFIDTDFTLPVDIEFDIKNIGGPSAGLMFSLGIVDILTPGELTGGEVIAGTGTMGVDGIVGPIGSIRQKMHGAARDGAQWFLAPTPNCGEVVGHVPDGLQVFAVSDLAEAVEVVEGIAAGDVAELPRCGG